MAKKKCPLCRLEYDNIDSLSNHIEAEHGSEIPKGWSGGKYYFYSRNGRHTGKCIVCKRETEFNESTSKPNRICKDPKCKEIYRQDFRKRMINVYNKDTLLNDPDHQKKMLNNRSIAKDYKWSDGTIKRVIGSYEYDGCQFMDIFMQFDSNDVILPAPQVIVYKYEDKEHIYIPDAFIASLNLLIEFKDGGDNPNMHPKIQRVDKKKEKAKELALSKYGFNYIKIENKQYGGFVNLVNRLRNMEVISGKGFTPIIITNEMVDILLESSLEPKTIKIVVFKDIHGMQYVGLYVNDIIYSYIFTKIYKYNFSEVTILKEYEILFNDYKFKELLYDNIDTYINSSIEMSFINNVNFPLALIYELHMVIGREKCFISSSDIDEYMIYDTYLIKHLDKFDFLSSGIYLPKMKSVNIQENMNVDEYIGVGEYDTYVETVVSMYNNKRMEFMKCINIDKQTTSTCIDLIDAALNYFEVDIALNLINDMNKLDNNTIITQYAIELLHAKREMMTAISTNLGNKEEGLVKIDPLKIHRDKLLQFDKKYNSYAKRFTDCLSQGVIDYNLIHERNEYLDKLDESVDDDELYYLGIKSI